MALLLVPAMAALPGAAAAAPAAAGPAHLRPVAAQKPVPVHVVRSHPLPVPANRPWHLPRTVWPAAGTATVPVAPARSTGGRARAGTAMFALPSPGSSHAGSLPVWIGPAVGAAAAPGSVRVAMASRNAAAAAGVSGVIFTVAQAGAARASLPVHVSLNYSSFAYTDGGDFAARLHLVELPACALTTPSVSACRREVPLASSNDVKAFRLGADVRLPALTPVGGGWAASPVFVLAATTATNGSAGDYTATPLSEAGTWSEGGSSGAFTYSYPIQVPQVPGGLVPSVALGYDSQAADGLTSSTNNQASWVGDGWDYQPGFIERDYQSCEQTSKKTGDLCWSANNVTTLSLGGMTTALVDDPTNGWHAESDNGYKITYVKGSGSCSVADDSWVVLAPNGVSYHFGLNKLPGWVSGKPTTGSVFSVPVYATASGQPCFNSTFSLSHGMQAWRWNLDWVTDPHGDAMAYYYQSETNFYAADNGTKATASYTQGGVLASIQYGLRSASAYTTPAAQVTFTSAADRTDVPTGSSDDLACASGATCNVLSPTFWAKYELTTIATSTLEGTAQQPVDSWALTHEYLSTGSGTPAPLWLQQITQTGEDPGGTSTPALPPVVFHGMPLDNRTMTPANLQDGNSMIPRNRIVTVTMETGGTITVTYDTAPAACTSGTFPKEYANTLLCYPTFWTPPGQSQREDWFNKYVVSDITQANTEGGTVQVNTAYSYAGAGWHYDDDALTRSANRTWDQWRGFAQVTAETGNAADGDPVTKTTDSYFQGMNGDYQNGNPVTSASLTSLVGNVTVTDSPQFAGMSFEHTVYNGLSGPIVTDTVTTPWSSAATATQSQPSPLPALAAYLTGTAQTQAFTGLASGGYREADTTYAHDSAGRVTSVAAVPDARDNGGGGDPSEDTCTQTSYDPNTTTGLTDLPAEVIVTSVAPANCPVSGTPTQSELVADTKYYYDSATSITTPPTKGDVTQLQQATAYSGASEVFTTTSKKTFDEYGRVQTALDANAIANSGNPTTTAYTPLTGAEATSVSVTDPMGLKTTTTYDPARDLPLTVTDPAGLVTTKTYDSLGRLTGVWTPGHATGGPADETFSYSPLNAAPYIVTTNKINTAGTYLTSETMYDSLGRQLETQSETPDGNRDITDTYYNSDGWVVKESSPYYASGLPDAKLVAATDDQVPSQTGYAYDGTGRVVRQITYSLANEQWETDTSYGGNYTSVTPPQGGTAETTYINGIGKTSYIYQYHAATAPAAPPTPGSGSATGSSGYDQTSYVYYPSGKLKTITDATAKNTWSYGYDLHGDQTSASDPDSGSTTSTYDQNGNLLSVTNTGLKTTTSYTYDADNRKTFEYDTTGGAAESASDELAAWTWDTLSPGKLTSSVAYAGGTSGTKYTQSATGYNSLGMPQGSNTQISTGTWSGSYRELFGYTPYADLEANITYPSAGGLPSEEVSIGYNAADQPADVGSSLWNYVATLTYTELGQPQEYVLGTSTEPAWIFNGYNQVTNQLATSEVQTGVSPVTVSATTYGYDNAGLITSEADTPASGPTQVQCFSYDYLTRLDHAWSQGTSDCSAGPSQSAESGAAAGYWDQYGYDLASNLTSVISTPPSGSATTTASTFPAPGSTAGGSTPPSPPHGVAGTGPPGTTTTSYSYDAGGHVTKIAGPTNTQNLNWNDAGQLTSVASTGGPDPGTTSYAYDALGNLLLQQDAGLGTATLYLHGEQLTETTGSSPTYTSTRYYSIGGVTIAARTSAGAVSYLMGNQQGTASLAIDTASLAATYRYYDPFGNPVGAAPTAWPGTKGFVGGTADTATGLTNLGAREYNSGTAAFVSPDPIIDAYKPQDLNAYAYATDDPTSLSDPTGLDPGSNCPPGNITLCMYNYLQQQNTSPTGGRTTNTGPGSSTSDVNTWIQILVAELTYVAPQTVNMPISSQGLHIFSLFGSGGPGSEGIPVNKTPFFEPLLVIKDPLPPSLGTETIIDWVPEEVGTGLIVDPLPPDLGNLILKTPPGNQGPIINTNSESGPESGDQPPNKPLQPNLPEWKQVLIGIFYALYYGSGIGYHLNQNWDDEPQITHGQQIKPAEEQPPGVRPENEPTSGDNPPPPPGPSDLPFF
jgi:RHS repeat-associated protein